MSNSINERALSLLGSGVQAEKVASALGVTPGYVSQLLAEESFAAQVTQLRYENLSKHTQRDASIDEVEDLLIEKLKRAVPLLIRPAEIIGAFKVFNGAKRRGVDSASESIVQNNIVQITMPVQLIQKFTTNIKNQVIQAGDQSLLTMQSSDLRKKVEEAPVLEVSQPAPPAPSKKLSNTKLPEIDI